MKFFKKALIATAILGTVGAAQAATVSSTPLKLSAEGAMYGVQATAQTLTFDIVVDKDHPSASTITLAFDENVDLTDEFGNDLTGCTNVTQGVSAGKAICGDIGFDYGTGSFTFDNVVITHGDATKGETDSISFKVNLGNPLYANSAFRIVLGQHDYDTTITGTDRALVKGESNLSYSSVDAANAPIETGTGVIAVEESQFGFAVTQELDGIIKRIDQNAFIDAAGNAIASDVAKFTFTNKEATQGLSLDVTAAEVRYDGKFTGVETWAANTTDVGSLNYGPTGKPTTEVSVDMFGNSYTPWATAEEKATVTFTNGTAVIPSTGAVTASAVILAASNDSATAGIPVTGFVVDSADAGMWVLDATVINVPYFPVGYEGTSSSVHFANESGKVADVTVTAIDDESGEVFGPFDLGKDLPAYQVTKVKQGEIMELFSVTGTAKLSLTFNIDADNGDVNAYATVTSATGRSEVSTSQQRK